MITTHRETYHAIRRAMTKRSVYGGKGFITRATTVTEANRYLKDAKVKMPRGMGEFRERAIRAVIRAKERHTQPSLAARLAARVASKYVGEIERRGGDTFIQEENRQVHLYAVDRDIKAGLVLLWCTGWRYYSRRFGSKPATLAYLCGRDDNGPFAVRVAGSVRTVRDALEFLEPAEVQRARDEGRTVARQGDVYVIEMRRDSARQSDLPPRHYWDAASRTLRHADGHAALHIPHPAKFVTQSAYRMGRDNRRGRGD